MVSAKDVYFALCSCAVAGLCKGAEVVGIPTPFECSCRTSINECSVTYMMGLQGGGCCWLTCAAVAQLSHFCCTCVALLHG